MKTVSALLGLFLCTSTGFAAVYKWTDSEGRVHYGDRPVEGAEIVTSVPLTTYKPPATPAQPENGNDQQDVESVSYALFAFVSPTNDATIRDNTGNIGVQLSIDPPLRQGHSISISIDGSPLDGALQATTFTLSNVDRGTHTLQAAIVDGEGNTLIETEPTTVHMRRVSVLNPNNPNN